MKYSRREGAMSALANVTRALEDAFQRIFVSYMNSLRSNTTAQQAALRARVAAENFSYVILYLLVMMGMFSFVIVAILVSTVKPQRRERPDDPHHQYLEDDRRGGYKNRVASAAEPHLTVWENPGATG
ncbi:potassium voltage-gated channel subfamily E member 2 isoform X2 [Ornithorhynchus anatinus]|uniref:potassium voltage-gated channel subfamily E member 2 isoform X2 n=1 Tax=Ornithorhynchus anatinus TaxID=9258 RepID=UPI0010A78CD2|nr:potassium voltage-gated channel subfamily E member 2 isoform X2 [Ornithorhynchus anatinus]